MNDEYVDTVVEEIERGLRVEDPGFVRRMDAVRRADACTVVAVFVLLAIGAVLLTIGFATLSVLPWSLGSASLIAAVVVDDRHTKALRRQR